MKTASSADKVTTMTKADNTEKGEPSSKRITPKDEHMLREIVESSPIPTFVIDKDHTIIGWNRLWRR